MNYQINEVGWNVSEWMERHGPSMQEAPSILQWDETNNTHETIIEQSKTDYNWVLNCVEQILSDIELKGGEH